MFDLKLSMTPAHCAAAMLLMNQAAGGNGVASLLQVTFCPRSACDVNVFCLV